MSPVRAICALASVLGALLALPAVVHAAPAIFASKGCYVINTATAGEPQYEPVTVTGTGFAPGVHVEVFVDGRRVWVTPAPTDASGGFVSGPLRPPLIQAGERSFVIAAQEQHSPGQRAQTRTRVAVFGVTATNRSTRPTGKVTYTARGWTNPLADPADALASADVLYAHYRFNGRRVKDVRLGRVTGPCGTLVKRVRQLPVRRPRIGTYRVQFDLSPRYRSKTFPYVALDITVLQRPKAPPPSTAGSAQ